MYNWEVQINFKVHGHGKDLYGDGIAIWWVYCSASGHRRFKHWKCRQFSKTLYLPTHYRYTKDPLQPGPVFGSKDHFQGLAVFLDTYANQNGHHNHGHPYISAMVNNGSLSYDHDRFVFPLPNCDSESTLKMRVSSESESATFAEMEHIQNSPDAKGNSAIASTKHLYLSVTNKTRWLCRRISWVSAVRCILFRNFIT